MGKSWREDKHSRDYDSFDYDSYKKRQKTKVQPKVKREKNFMQRLRVEPGDEGIPDENME